MRVERKLLKNNAILEKQALLIQSLEGLGDILVFETERQKNELVINGLQKIRVLMEKIFEIRSEDPEYFDL